MEIYIEFAIIDNLVIDYVLLFLTAKTIKLSTNRLKLFFAALIGTALAIALPLILLPNWFLLIVKLVIPIIMLLVVSDYRNIKHFSVSYLFLLTYTFLMGGACLGALFLMNAKIFGIISLDYEYIFPVGVIVLIITSFTKLTNFGIKYFYRRKTINNYLYDIKILLDNRVYSLVAFLDSGNLLCDSKTNLPVLIVSKESLAEINFNKFNKTGYFIPYSTINGSKNNMFVFKPERIEVFEKGDNQKINIGEMMVGVIDKKFKDYNCLLPSSLFI